MNAETIGTWNNRILGLLEEGKFNTALKDAKTYIQEEPDNSFGYALLARIYFEKDEYKQAVRWSSESLSREPIYYLAWDMRIRSLMELEQYKAANQTADEAIEHFPDEDSFFFLKGVIEKNLNHIKKAVGYLETAFGMEPDQPMYAAHYSHALALSGKKELSERVEEAAIEMNADDATIYLLLGWASEARGDYARALELIEHAVRLVPDDKELRDEYIEMLQKQYKVLRFFMAPYKLLERLPGFVQFFILVVTWLAFRPLILLFLLFYVLMHWGTKLIVNKKVFGTLSGK